MEIKICQNKQEWDNWELARELVEFLQSWDWGEFQRATGKDVLRLQMAENGQVLWQGQGFTHKLGWALPAVVRPRRTKAGLKYLYVPRMQNADLSAGALAEADNRIQDVFDFLKSKGFAFVRLEPEKDYHISPFGRLRAGYITYHISSTKNRQPQNTLVLNINKTETDLIATMHEKTRYNIRLAEKKNVIVRKEKDIETFWRLNLATTGRDKFKSHEKEYYKKMLENNFCHQLTAYYPFGSAPFGSAQGRPIAAILLIVFGRTITYLHGVSGNAHRNLMAPYLLQWEGIKLGKKLGCKYYDFGGIAPDTKVGATTCFNNFCWPAEHRWTGITRFKAGFGGERRDYPAAVDIVLSGWRYRVYKVAKMLASF